MLPPAAVARQPSRRTVGIELAATAQAVATPRPALWGPLCCYHKHNRPAWLGARRALHNGRNTVSPEAQTSVANVYPYTRASPGPIAELIGSGAVIVPPAMYNTLPRTEPATNCLAVGRLVPAIRNGWG
jgi:hypothetical protein